MSGPRGGSHRRARSAKEQPAGGDVQSERRGRSHAAPGEGIPATRWLIIGLVVVVLAVVGIVDGRVQRSAPAPGLPLTAVTSVPSPAAETSSWYCVGATGTAGSTAQGTIDLVNTGAHAVSGSMTVVNDQGQSRSSAVMVGARSEVSADPSATQGGRWIAARVELAGGGVLATESVQGSTGWSEAPCARTTSPNWYFASGSTAGGSSLYATVFNPSATSAVVNFTFVTGSGVSQPQPFQGVVVPAGKLVTEPVGKYVQNQTAVATVVQALSGRVVADELETVSSGSGQGLSLRLGAPTPSTRWVLPDSIDPSGGRTDVSVFNPTSSAENVTVTVRLPSGPVTPLHRSMAPDTAWDIETSGIIRIPAGTGYAATVSVKGGPGVVVDRRQIAPNGAGSPQWGAVTAADVSALPATGPAISLLAAPGTGSSPAVSGAAPYAVALENPGSRTTTAIVEKLTSAGVRPVAGIGRIVLHPGGFAVVPQAALAPAGLDPLVVKSAYPVVVVEDAAPSGTPGAVNLVASPETS